MTDCDPAHAHCTGSHIVSCSYQISSKILKLFWYKILVCLTEEQPPKLSALVTMMCTLSNKQGVVPSRLSANKQGGLFPPGYQPISRGVVPSSLSVNG